MRVAKPAARPAFLLAAFALAGCHLAGDPNNSDSGSSGSKPYDAISDDDTLHIAGTEPFWNGDAQGDTLTFATPSNPDGTKITVTRFGGRNGLGLSGTLDGKTLDLTVTPGRCTDGMSAKRYPFTVTLKLGDDIREGCGWTDRKPFTLADSK